ncbi:Nif11-like leader peptide family RiPP precursor [Cyanobium sp. WAJ14-Wanaka]|uniref:Nif11-like leader peptide family RiPP precursor n=1 Tax=Cyanobium sp. WAJ14-Wanaka TaxID=2823725 RepID=UPI0020CE68D5|nr:Nif11-like leader peptide family RiPP precursor [Cyanobium sp. WAJ14-Wanaka]MCP9775134.1 Nif11-like leader peptide family RiPP precursor [Cyanobium sp. WAJ14-Wanaka]
MSLAQLDAFLAQARSCQKLQQSLAEPLELEAFLALARGAGYPLDEADVIAAQQRQESSLSDGELQARAGVEARKLRNFIQA